MHRCHQHRFASLLLRIFLLLCSVVAVSDLSAQSTSPQSSRSLEASTSNAAKRDAIKSIPFQNIAPSNRNAIRKVVNECSLYRRMPTGIVPCGPDMFTFLMQHPEILVEMWRELGISRVDLVKTGSNTFQISDNAGTTAKLTIVEQKCEKGAQNRIIMFADGAYEGKMFKSPVRAQCVLLLRSGSFHETNDRTYVAARLDTFVRIDRTSIKLFAKAMHPWVGKTADRNFIDTMKFVSNLSQAGEKNPETIERLVNRLSRIPERDQKEILQITYESAKNPKAIKQASRVTMLKQ